MIALIPVKTQYRWTGSISMVKSFTRFLAFFGHSSKRITWSGSYHTSHNAVSSSTEILSHPLISTIAFNSRGENQYQIVSYLFFNLSDLDLV